MTYLKLYSLIFAPFFVIYLTAAIFVAEIKPASEKGIKSPQITGAVGSTTIDRRQVLKTFLEKYNSPLAEHVDTFIFVADKYGMDYRLLPAISCIESTCGKHMPYNSFNAWGWGVYGNNVIRFKNFDNGIETVGKGLYEGYIKKGLDTPKEIAPIYTPPQSNHWLKNVSKFMVQMDDISKSLQES